jgi:hypothetical protein
MAEQPKRNPKQVSAGLGIDMLNPKARAIAFDVLPKLLPTVSVGLNDYHQTHLLWEATGRKTLMVFRHVYDPYDDQWWLWKPQDWKNHYMQVHENVKQFGKDYSRDLVHQFMNEPKDITNRSEQWIDFVLDVLRWGKQHGFRFAFPIPNVEVEWNPLMVEGKFDRLLKAYDDEKFREHGHIGFIHEYTLFHINEGLAASRVRGDWDAMWPDAFLHPDKMTPDNWATKAEVEALWASNYTLCRGMRVNKRMATLERAPIPLVRLEGFWDKLPHLEKWVDPRTNKERNIYNEVLARYQVKPPSPHTAFAGAASLEPLYRKMLPHIDWSKGDAFATSIVEQIQHVHEVEPDYYLGTAWFQLDPDDSRWDINGGYSPHRIPHIWQKFYDWRDELAGVTVPPVEPPPPQPVTSAPPASDPRWYETLAYTYADTYANIRADETEASTDLGDFKADKPGRKVKIIYMPRENPYFPLWDTSGTGVRGWCNELYVVYGKPPMPTVDDPRWQEYKAFAPGVTAPVRDWCNAQARTIGGIIVGGVVVKHIPQDKLTAMEKAYLDRWNVLMVNGLVGYVQPNVTFQKIVETPSIETVTIEVGKLRELEKAASDLVIVREEIERLNRENVALNGIVNEYRILKRLISKPIDLPEKETAQ